MWDPLGKAADIASLVSLLVSTYAAWQITAVRRQVTFDARIDEKIREIEAFLTWFDENIASFPENRRDVTFRIDECVAWLERIKWRMPKDVCASIKDIKKIRQQYLHEKDEKKGLNFLWILNLKVTLVVKLIWDTVKDRRIGGYDGRE